MNARLLVTLAILCTATLATFTIPSVGAAGSTKRECSLRTLDGAYGGIGTGTTGSSEPIANQALVHYHGDGTAVATGVTMQQTSGPTTFTTKITYTLSGDCTGSLTSVKSTGEIIHDSIVVTSNGAKIYLLRTNPGGVLTAVEERVHT